MDMLEHSGLAGTRDKDERQISRGIPSPQQYRASNRGKVKADAQEKHERRRASLKQCGRWTPCAVAFVPMGVTIFRYRSAG
ncbi:hypothetical protein [Caballeronia sp. LZ035]|uniref:hypothetical protein n=1 Tax=Caballeronia sp. LZ035 TaxID=3038568 RepID=UPI002863EF8D|nr:hypothetical protein [Caballeronia sp. LZ035]MDR5761537.1 hypothetical protein [Caballeronia sp. LZ035]